MIHSQPPPNFHTTPTDMCVGPMHVGPTYMGVGVVWELGGGRKASISLCKYFGLYRQVEPGAIAIMRHLNYPY